MSLLPYILGLIGSMITAAGFVLFNRLTGMEFHSLTFWAIVPAGGIMLGLGGGAGLFLGRKLTNTKLWKVDYFVAIILGLLTFFSVNYISFQTTYVLINDNDEAEFVYKFSQPENYTRISELINFKEYIEMINSGSVYEFGRADTEFELGKTSTTIFFYLQILGALFGSLIAALSLKNSKYCENCKVYYKKKILKKFDMENLDSYWDVLNKNIHDGSALKNIIDEFKNRKIVGRFDSKKEWKLGTLYKEVGEAVRPQKYGQIEIFYCPGCRSGSLFIKFFEQSIRGEHKEIAEEQKELALDSSVVEILMKK